ncbi:ABC transporter ATP-binding protein [Demequina sp. NBRC 110054]|uniref:ABC transporter ATP-binding protein n=1 Tax=Demequina sp. NBRC 110054 TaxID=1570343 RepID=UPI000A00ED0B|nr:ABC transporter ATP-binding protein [Demequina sp. NBRC 110054]
MTVQAEAPSGHALHAQGVRRSFGSVQAVINASLTLTPGTVTALIGPNGCGKTTLMLMLAGLLRPDGGTVEVLGHDPVTAGAVARRGIGWMPDVLGMWDSLTCAETLETFGRAYGLPRNEATERAFAMLEKVHLADLAAQPARVLSRGQKQRLSLARALMGDPAVLILDEPASGLDPRSRIELRDLVRALASEGRAVLISSHVLSELDEMVDEAVFMSRGVTLGESADAEVARARARWRVTALPGHDVHAALSQAARDWSPVEGADASVAVVHVADADDAADLLASLVGQGIRISAFGPVGSALEQAYLTIEQERR